MCTAGHGGGTGILPIRVAACYRTSEGVTLIINGTLPFALAVTEDVPNLIFLE